MSKENFEIALQFLFPSEGGYVNDKDDKSGPTNMGITQLTYNNYRKRKGLPLNDVKNITKIEAVNLYYEEYWKLSGADNISDPNMAVALFDTAVLHGPYRAKQYYEQSNKDLNKFLDIRQKSYEIRVQMNSIGIPYEKDLPQNVKTFSKEKSYSTNPEDGKWVTINGNHVFIEK